MRILPATNQYTLINIVFLFIILMVFAYSYAYPVLPDTLRLKSDCTRFSVENCPSTGLSRGFAMIVRLKFEQAKEFNPYSMQLFLFFFIQLFARLLFSVLQNRFKKVYIADSVFSVLLFACCFWPMVIQVK